MFVFLLTTFLFQIASICFLLFGIVYGSLYSIEWLLILSLVAPIFTSLFLMFAFSKYVLSSKIILSTYNFFDFHNDENVEIVVSYEKSRFIANFNGKEITFEVDTPIFKKSMFFAYVVRNIRFKEVSDKLPLMMLFKRKLILENSKTNNFTLVINGKKKSLVKNGVSYSKWSFINKAFYFKDLSLQPRTRFHPTKTVCTIDEEIFEKGKMIVS